MLSLKKCSEVMDVINRRTVEQGAIKDAQARVKKLQVDRDKLQNDLNVVTAKQATTTDIVENRVLQIKIKELGCDIDFLDQAISRLEKETIPGEDWSKIMRETIGTCSVRQFRELAVKYDKQAAALAETINDLKELKLLTKHASVQTNLDYDQIFKIVLPKLCAALESDFKNGLESRNLNENQYSNDHSAFYHVSKFDKVNTIQPEQFFE